MQTSHPVGLSTGAASVSRDFVDMLDGKLRVVHSHRSINKSDCYVRSTASAIYQRCEPDQVQRCHKVSFTKARDRLIRLSERHLDWALGFGDEV